MSLLTLSIIAIICVIFLIIGIILDSNLYGLTKTIFCVIGIIGVLITGAVGFGAHASKTENIMTVEKVEVDTIVKSKTTVYVELSNESKLEYTSKKDYDLINNDIIFYKVTYYNLYDIDVKTFHTYDTIFKPFLNKGKVESIKQ